MQHNKIIQTSLYTSLTNHEYYLILVQQILMSLIYYGYTSDPLWIQKVYMSQQTHRGAEVLHVLQLQIVLTLRMKNINLQLGR